MCNHDVIEKSFIYMCKNLQIQVLYYKNGTIYVHIKTGVHPAVMSSN